MGNKRQTVRVACSGLRLYRRTVQTAAYGAVRAVPSGDAPLSKCMHAGGSGSPAGGSLIPLAALANACNACMHGKPPPPPPSPPRTAPHCRHAGWLQATGMSRRDALRLLLGSRWIACKRRRGCWEAHRPPCVARYMPRGSPYMYLCVVACKRRRGCCAHRPPCVAALICTCVWLPALKHVLFTACVHACMHACACSMCTHARPGASSGKQWRATANALLGTIHRSPPLQRPACFGLASP